MSHAASQILGNRGGGPSISPPRARRAQSPPPLKPEEFFAHNAHHLRQRNQELAEEAARRRPQRGDQLERAAGPIPSYILAKRGVQARGGHYHERRRGKEGIIPSSSAPRCAFLAGTHVPPAGAGSGSSVIDRTEVALESVAGPAAPAPRFAIKERHAWRPDRSRLMPYNNASPVEEEENSLEMLSPLRKQKVLLAKGWKLAVGGNAATQKWSSPSRPSKTFTGLDTAYDEAFAHEATTAVQVIQVKQVCPMFSYPPLRTAL
jgi:hypothetical protein